jgi:hypothetical protein
MDSRSKVPKLILHGGLFFHTAAEGTAAAAAAAANKLACMY